MGSSIRLQISIRQDDLALRWLYERLIELEVTQGDQARRRFVLDVLSQYSLEQQRATGIAHSVLTGPLTSARDQPLPVAPTSPPSNPPAVPTYGTPAQEASKDEQATNEKILDSLRLLNIN